MKNWQIIILKYKLNFLKFLSLPEKKNILKYDILATSCKIIQKQRFAPFLKEKKK